MSDGIDGLVQMESSDFECLVSDSHELAERKLWEAEAARKAVQQNPFKRPPGFTMVHRESTWKTVAASSFDQRAKMVMYAWTHMRKDGHCPIRGNLGSVIFGKKVRSDNANNLVRRAVEEGFLAEGSNTRCLILPWGVRYMSTADTHSGCSLHSG
ncbi:hypothetical protein [Gordonia polyisoprenivorans]|uniref:hypothetical protein n=1 Tax=Gordonia polyisoprenivorans TaxID=84595 RepID=UPI002300DCA7|nr:hypothetical protein [Gordonia polyisoprenivorans]WCB35576.1 hypothetical protein PHA63_15800 [Gordonia polyisoprenivorans]